MAFSSHTSELLLKNNEPMFRSLIEEASDMIGTWNLDGLLTYISPSSYTMFGYKPEEWLGQSFIPLVHPDDLECCLIANQQVIETGERLCGVEFRNRHRLGHWVWVSLNITPVKDETGAVVAFQGMMRDISDRKAMEDALRFIVEGTASKSGDEFFRTCAKAIAEVFQVQYAFITELVDETFEQSKMLTLWTGETFVEPYEFALAGTPCQSVFQHDWGIFPDNVTARFPQASALATLTAESYLGVVIVDSHDRRIGNLGIIHTQALTQDLERMKSILQLFAARVGAEMERKAAEVAQAEYARQLEITLQELKRTQAQMIHSEKMSSLGQLVAGIAHEINNPVNFIHGNISHTSTYVQDIVELLSLYQKNYQPTPEIAEKIQEMDLDFLMQDLPQSFTSMKVGTERIREIVKSLRLFSRLDESEIKAINIHEGIDSTLMILQNRLKTQGDRPDIAVIQNYADLPLIECYPGQLNQVFMNILVNAIDALEELNEQRSIVECKQQPSKIEIITEMSSENWVSIRIIDNGIGIPISIQHRIFDPFFTTKRVGKGTGMGMSISYQIITEKHKGHLLCCSDPHHGTEFVIRIPVAQTALA